MKQCVQNKEFCSRCNSYFNFKCAPFYVLPARHFEAQDMSGNLKAHKTYEKTFIRTATEHKL